MCISVIAETTEEAVQAEFLERQPPPASPRAMVRQNVARACCDGLLGRTAAGYGPIPLRSTVHIQSRTGKRRSRKRSPCRARESALERLDAVRRADEVQGQVASLPE